MTDTEMIRLYGDLVSRMSKLEGQMEMLLNYLAQGPNESTPGCVEAQPQAASFKEKAVQWLREKKARGEL